ncbi:bifunctional 4-hydroxy-2-oxoglutarate aldolase/2-dehydro-3-deoxy-phosphogluconate aldolase [Oceanicella actignis]|uniref:2-dehydro-3-deoxy-phosphogluconate aldolase n=1 Tax=Oceanicella actignis TaxID=1189325 RepID=A0A1M7TCK9_9RHOB|nr:bifunctional 4-hydroxy-2-oxoglutarate aldolase/2-dehydro-3-deoxy-phosphogluconate aldolase [Oceanicella actignis]TYO89251.1 2-dehydro-3-deoxyphosphogluconate aldolase/(4S)-4-hydroxy-2-oxoglutarate aldolase [Oceanicella actignis]SET55238.1 2-dehydro-3-deoxyphosphogluconate aldolase / (4S)-4-hydroxy-2-oxoglutarate aldolase [Oceanicella actignis]SHN68397.1 2-dehydro-3-deoxyphosphogluconate aldolase / (4S)-4-hydroxy-2-oxoglutarate aldolase [Oceanicella actignis]
MNAEDVCRLAPVIPVLTVADARTAGPLARALTAGGLYALEVTLRTPAALDAIRAMAQEAPDAVVGAGTLTEPAHVEAALAAGARFGVSPGATPALLEAARAAGLPLLPGVATPSEAMAAMERGYRTLKFFPAEVNGGVAALRAWSGPLAELRFCPTGGISRANAPDYLALGNVLCVGGSWIAPPELIAAEDWEQITRLAAEAAALRPRAR